MRVKSVKVNINHRAIAQLNKAKERALELTAEAMRSDIVSRAVVPKETGQLEQGSEKYKSGYVEQVRDFVYAIVYDTPYARRWYFNLDGATFQRTQNVNAQDHWMDYYLDGEGKQWVQDTFAEFLKQESGGLIT